jgi:hypothetical protein
MNRKVLLLFCFYLLLFMYTASVKAQAPARQDVVWARTTTETITLDGKLNETSWAKADSLKIVFGKSSGLPTSGWSTDGYSNPSGNADSVHATLKFLSQNNQLYIAFIIPDSSIDGHDWPGPAWWDGVLMNVKDIRTIPVGREEIFPTFLFTDTTTGGGVGSGPLFGYHGKFRNQRTAAETAKWDMGYVINGTSNDDSLGVDTGYVFEMRINLDSLGYNTTQPGGGIVALNISIYDCDWYFQSNPLKRAVSRAYWQHAWSDQNDNVGRVMISPDVTVNSGPAPDVPPDVVIPNGAKDADPTIDGDLSDPVWNGADSIMIKYGDTTNIRSYPGVGKYMSAWFEANINNSSPAPEVLDPGEAVVKMFFKNNFLYLSANVKDQLIQSDNTSQDKKDGVRFILGLRDSINTDGQMVFQNLLADFDSSGNAKGDEDLDTLIKQGAATLAMTMNGTLNNMSDVDVGYTVELKLDLTKLGYASDLGDHLLFGGVDLLDADSFDDPASDYGSRTWFYKENKGGGPTAWMYMDPNVFTTDVKEQNSILPGSIVLYGNYPNPFNPSTNLSYSIPRAGQVNLLIYNILGQQVSNTSLLYQTAGLHVFSFNGASLASGVYFYRIKLTSGDKGQEFLSKTGKMVLLK